VKDQRDREQSPIWGTVKDLATVGVGAAAADRGIARIHGAPTYYHGAADPLELGLGRVESIRREGLRSEFGGTGASRVHEDMAASSAGKVHVTTSPRSANFYRRYYVPDGAPVGDEMYDVMGMVPSAGGGEVFKFVLPKGIRDTLVEDLDDGAAFTTHMNIPADVVNQTLADRALLKLKNVPSHVMEHPGQAALGAGLLAVGGGAAYLGGRRLYDRYIGSRDAKEAGYAAAFKVAGLRESAADVLAAGR